MATLSKTDSGQIKYNDRCRFDPDGKLLVYNDKRLVWNGIDIFNDVTLLVDGDSSMETGGTASQIAEDINLFFFDGDNPPSYDDLTLWFNGTTVEDGAYLQDQIGVRDGEVFPGIYATGIEQLNLTDLTGLTIAEFYGTSTYSIVDNSVILDPLLTFSSFVDSDGNIYSLESINEDNTGIIGTQTCEIIGTPVLLESIDYKSWRNLLGYNEITGDYSVDGSGDYVVDGSGDYFIDNLDS